MTDINNARPIGSNPIADAASATAPSTAATDTTYPADAPKVSSNADLRIKEDDDLADAAMSPTGADIDNDHADERPIDRSQDSSQSDAGNEEDDDLDDEDDDEDDDDDEQFTPTE